MFMVYHPLNVDILNTLDNQSPELNGTPSPLEAQKSILTIPTVQTTSALTPSPTQQQQQQMQLSQSSQSKTTHKPYVKIVEQPASKALRFRYECEGRLAGSIPGVNSTPENRTFPTIEIVGYKGNVVVVVSCVTKDPPYRPHPHNLVGKDGYKNGICTLKLSGEPLRASFSNLGIQCVKKRDIKTALDLRQKMKVDPFRTKFSHKDQPSSIDLNVVRLCFQAFLEIGDEFKPLTPVVSDPIFDRKAMSDLVICRLCSCSAKVGGGDEIILLCEKVSKDDIKVRFYEISHGDQLIWEDYADFQQTDIHKQTAIAFKTPRYHNTDITDRAKVFLQLVRPSDGKTSEAIPFEYYPDPGTRTFIRIRRKLRRKQDLEIFQQILSLDSETTATKYSCPATDVEADIDELETVSTASSVSKLHSTDTLNEYDEAVKRQTESETDGCDADVDIVREIEIELEVPHINYPAADESTQTSTPMEEILKHPELDAPRQLSAIDKITEWMRSSEFERTDSLTVENGDNSSLSPVTVITSLSTNNHTTISTAADEDKTFTDLMEQVAEFDDLFAAAAATESRRGTLENPNLKELPMTSLDLADNELSEIAEAYEGGTSAQASIELDETFDETATYTSLQIAFKNPIDIPNNNTKVYVQVQSQASIVPSTTARIEQKQSAGGLVVITNPPAPKIRVNTAQTPPSPPSPPLPLPPRTPSPVLDQKLPPLPPKRKPSQELSSSEQTPSGSSERFRNGSINSRPPSQIIIMRTPDQSPTKRQPTPTSSPKKKQGFFSRLFSRRKSKAEMNPISTTATNSEVNSKSGGSKATTPTGSREPSIGHFSFSTDPNRSSMRSVHSIQPPPNSPGLHSQNSTNAKSGKPVGRSVSSVSGKRPANLNADVIHIPLKGDESSNSLSQHSGTITFGRLLDRKTLSALQLADIPVCDGNMELVAITDRQSIKNLCEGAYGVVLDADVDLDEAEHFALYTSMPPTSGSDYDGKSSPFFNQNEAGDILTADEVARRLTEANTFD